MSGVQPGKTTEPLSTTSTPSGLATDFRITTMTVPDTATAIPATALSNRVALSITNLDAVEVLYLGKSTVTADQAIGTTAGWEVGPSESFNVDIADSLVIFGRAETGKTILIKVLEIS